MSTLFTEEEMQMTKTKEEVPSLTCQEKLIKMSYHYFPVGLAKRCKTSNTEGY